MINLKSFHIISTCLYTIIPAGISFQVYIYVNTNRIVYISIKMGNTEYQSKSFLTYLKNVNF